MKLTKSELARLRNFHSNREHPPTALHGLWRVKWLLLSIVILIGVGFSISQSQGFRYFMLGLGVGGLWCLCGLAFILPRFWRLTREILDWDKIDQLLKEHQDESA